MVQHWQLKEWSRCQYAFLMLQYYQLNSKYCSLGLIVYYACLSYTSLTPRLIGLLGVFMLMGVHCRLVWVGPRRAPKMRWYVLRPLCPSWSRVRLTSLACLSLSRVACLYLGMHCAKACWTWYTVPHMEVPLKVAWMKGPAMLVSTLLCQQQCYKSCSRGFLWFFRSQCSPFIENNLSYMNIAYASKMRPHHQPTTKFTPLTSTSLQN